MGTDIHIMIAKKDKSLVEIEFDGRNYEWFDNLMHTSRSTDDAYDAIPWKYGMPEGVDEDSDEGGYFGHRYVTIAEYKDWFCDNPVGKKAGWVTTYDFWRYETYGIVPEELPRYYDSEYMNTVDYHFKEFTTLTPDADIIHAIMNLMCDDNTITDDDYIIFYFDN